MHSTARSMPAPAHEFDAPDLLQLLGAKGLAHWHRPLLLLLSRYAGWLSHYEFDPTLDDRGGYIVLRQFPQLF